MFLGHKAIREAIRHLTSSIRVMPARPAWKMAVLQDLWRIWFGLGIGCVYGSFPHGVKFKPGRSALLDGKCFISERMSFSSELLKGTFGF